MNRRLAGIVTALLFLLPRSVAACSLKPGVDRKAYWEGVERFGYILGSISTVAAILLLLIVARKRPVLMAPRWIAATLVLMAVAQPAWWMNPYMGDCGTTRDLFGSLVALTSVSLLIMAYREIRRTETAGG